MSKKGPIEKLYRSKTYSKSLHRVLAGEWRSFKGNIPKDFHRYGLACFEGGLTHFKSMFKAEQQKTANHLATLDIIYGLCCDSVHGEKDAVESLREIERISRECLIKERGFLMGKVVESDE